MYRVLYDEPVTNFKRVSGRLCEEGSSAYESGEDEFEYQVEDVNGAIVSGTVSVRIRSYRDEANTAPIGFGTTSFNLTCNNASSSADGALEGGNTTSNSTSTSNLTDASCVPAVRVLEGQRGFFVPGASDKETARDSLNFSIATPPSHGTVALVKESFDSKGVEILAKNTLVYTPDPLWHGYDALYFQVSDGGKLSNETAVHFVVEPVNHPPSLACSPGPSLQNFSASVGGATIQIPAGSEIIQGTSASRIDYDELFRAAAGHSICTSPVPDFGHAPLLASQVEDAHNTLRAQLRGGSNPGGTGLPSSLSGGGKGEATGVGLLRWLMDFQIALLSAHDGNLPMVVAAGTRSRWTVPMGGG